MKNKKKIKKKDLYFNENMSYELINFLDHKVVSLNKLLTENPVLNLETAKWTKKHIKEFKQAIKIVKLLTKAD